MQDFDEKIKEYLYYFDFGGKMLLFAQLCDRNFGGMRSRRSPKLQHMQDFDEKIKKYLYYFGGMRSRRSPKVQHI